MKRQLFVLLSAAVLFFSHNVYAQQKTAAAPAPKKSFDSNGVKINYIVKGEGEPVLLIHGFTGSYQMNWMPVIENLSKDHKVIAYDNRGHGQSGKPHDPSAYGLEMVEDAVRILDHVGVQKAHVVGYSMGGFITAKLLTVHPDRMISATLGGAGWTKPDDELMTTFMNELAESLETGNGVTPLILRLHPAGRPPLAPEALNGINQLLSLTNDVKALAAVVRGMRNFQVTESQWKENEVPVMALIGEVDPLKQGVDAMIGVVPNLEILVIEEADHMNAFRRPEFVTAVRGFIGKHAETKENATASTAE